jgi:hypothetical protein
MMQRSMQTTVLGLVLAIAGSPVIPGTKAMADTPPIWYDCLTREAFTPEKQTWCKHWQALQNATFVVPSDLGSNPEYKTVTLKNGRYQQADNQFIVELVNQQGWLTFGDFNSNGKTDAAVIFGVALDPDGKTVATYLTAVLDVDGKAQALTPIKLGERIRLNGPIEIGRNQIAVPLLTQTEVINRVYGINGTNLNELTLRCA